LALYRVGAVACIKLVPDVLYVDEGAVLTAAGSAAGINLCLHVVRKDYGVEAATSVARRLGAAAP
jgi:AraC family transcriptional regulator, transcriptional activator FtrA